MTPYTNKRHLSTRPAIFPGMEMCFLAENTPQLALMGSAERSAERLSAHQMRWLNGS